MEDEHGQMWTTDTECKDYKFSVASFMDGRAPY